MLRQRSASAVIIVLAAAVPAILGNPVITIAVTVLAVLTVSELCRVLGRAGSRPDLVIATIVAGSLILSVGFNASALIVAGISTLGLLSILVLRLARRPMERATGDIAMTVFAVVYVAIPLAHLPAIRALNDHEPAAWLRLINDWSPFENPAAGLAWMVLIVAITWLTDTGAYLAGRAYGRNQLAPVLSPNKTIEGAITGTVTGIIAGMLFAALLGLPVPVYVAAVLGLLLSVASQLGDLAESMLKRDLGVKDMGNVIPGHGGILDRIDALLFTLPVGFYLIKLVLEINWT